MLRTNKFSSFMNVQKSLCFYTTGRSNFMIVTVYKRNYYSVCLVKANKLLVKNLNIKLLLVVVHFTLRFFRENIEPARFNTLASYAGRYSAFGEYSLTYESVGLAERSSSTKVRNIYATTTETGFCMLTLG
jgi:glucan phosphoethanolaminetransferase (alkaline phosphatase superfamily)